MPSYIPSRVDDLLVRSVDIWTAPPELALPNTPQSVPAKWHEMPISVGVRNAYSTVNRSADTALLNWSSCPQLPFDPVKLHMRERPYPWVWVGR
eukprot:1181902-Prorocentrum_minimum.AAC.4